MKESRGPTLGRHVWRVFLLDPFKKATVLGASYGEACENTVEKFPEATSFLVLRKPLRIVDEQFFQERGYPLK